MGLFSQLKRSNDKSKVMAQLINALKGPINSREVDVAMRAFYTYICDDFLLGPIIQKYNADYDTVKYLILKLDESVGGWYGGWHKNQYIPVSTFSFSRSLECALKEYREGSSIELILFEVKKLI